MKILRIGLIVIGGAALLLSIDATWNARQELAKVTAANDFLRKSLGDITIALTAKDKEIDRLQQTGCGGETKKK